MSEQNSGEQPPRPRYGEYAPPGYQPPTAQQPAPGQQAPGQHAPAQQGWGAAPQQPGWGAAPAQQYDPTAWGDPVKPARSRRVWDIVLTSILLFLGLLAGGYGVLTGIGLSAAIDLQHQARGLPPFTGDVSAESTVLVASQLVLWVATAALSVLALVRNRLAFWIALVGGVVAALFFWGALLAALLGDTVLMSTLTQG